MLANDVPRPFRATRLGRVPDRQAKTIGLLAEAATSAAREMHALDPDDSSRADPIARYAGVVAGRYSLRASDSDREDVAERLRAATAEGRLLAGELEERLEVALRARTYGELDALVVDLPVPRATVPATRRRPGLPVVAGATLALGILLSVLAASATAGFARAHSAVAGGPPWMHGRPDGFYHAGPAGLVGRSLRWS